MQHQESFKPRSSGRINAIRLAVASVMVVLTGCFVHSEITINVPGDLFKGLPIRRLVGSSSASDDLDDALNRLDSFGCSVDESDEWCLLIKASRGEAEEEGSGSSLRASLRNAVAEVYVD